MGDSVFAVSPSADSINSLQTWILVCIGFVFVSVVEYTVLLVMTRGHKRKGQLRGLQEVNGLSVVPYTNSHLIQLCQASFASPPVCGNPSRVERARPFPGEGVRQAPHRLLGSLSGGGQVTGQYALLL